MKEINIFNVATYFLKIVDRDAGSTITPLKLQKILYYAQGFYLAKHDVELFVEDFQAWAHGPANVEIYNKYKQFGYSAIEEPKENIPDIKEETKNFLFEIWKTFGIYDGKFLEELTHAETPWLEARKGCKPGENCTTVISKESMKEFFKLKLNEQ